LNLGATKSQRKRGGKRKVVNEVEQMLLESESRRESERGEEEKGSKYIAKRGNPKEHRGERKRKGNAFVRAPWRG